MSTSLPQYSLTSYPDNRDNYTTYSDITASDVPNVTQYYQYKSLGTAEGDILAAQVLENHPELKNKIINAKSLQRHEDQILAMQYVFDTEVINTFSQVIKYKGEYSATVTYSLFESVMYNGIPYMCIVQSAIGIVPSGNPNTWEMLAIVGASGTGLSFYPSYSTSQNYQIEDCVPYGNKLYVCIQANTNKIPSSSPDYWTSIITVTQQTICSQNQPENQSTGDIWLQIL